MKERKEKMSMNDSVLKLFPCQSIGDVIWHTAFMISKAIKAQRDQKSFMGVDVKSTTERQF